jgi:Fasciclin domain
MLKSNRRLSRYLHMTRDKNVSLSMGRLRNEDPESGDKWEKVYLPKTERDSKLYGWYHNTPFAKWNNYAYFCYNRRPTRMNSVMLILKHPELGIFGSILKKSSMFMSLCENRKFTIFAPKNSALSNSRIEDIDDFVKHHVIEGKIRTSRPPWPRNGIVSLAGTKLDMTSKQSNDSIPRQVFLTAGLIKSLVCEHDLLSSNGFVNIVACSLYSPIS